MKYIEKLIRTGGWFDDTRPFIKTSLQDDPKHYAPQYILENKEKFSYLLYPSATLPSDLNSDSSKDEEYDTDLVSEELNKVKHTNKEPLDLVPLDLGVGMTLD